ncbi:unnamed protein product [Protopolystoma xenopodis]|uniref:Uncharacterized protein n=1 Tax=Protopolystoma xenopodis TaxID=117903 RepID=A0A3S5B9B5_9PLAT|nr:unnamed protein product [Protopolystoma xenopodis]
MATTFSEFAYSKKFEGDAERETASSTANACEDSDLSLLSKLPAEVEFSNGSNAKLEQSSSYEEGSTWEMVSSSDCSDEDLIWEMVPGSNEFVSEISGNCLGESSISESWELC